jgi:Endonuclease/Exonuclease/phosphatase family
MHHGDISPEIAQGLLALRKRIAAAEIPSSKLDETINVAVWNIREFGKVPRTEAAIHYIAEILGQFDLVALVELRSDLTDLGRTLPILGPSWDIVYSDWIADAGGNQERLAFLFDGRAVTFNGLAAEVDAPRGKKETEYLTSQSFWRAPYMCSFRSGNFDFIVIATHARWGSSTKGRQAELQMLADWIDSRFGENLVEDHDLIVMGDFNVPKLGDKLFKALTSRGLQIPAALKTLKAGGQVVGGSNLGKNARYDQILHLPTVEKRFTNLGGVVDFFGSDAHIKELFPAASYDRKKFSFQLSDHLPLWVQIKTDIDGERFDQIVQNNKKLLAQRAASAVKRGSARR